MGIVLQTGKLLAKGLVRLDIIQWISRHLVGLARISSLEKASADTRLVASISFDRLVGGSNLERTKIEKLGSLECYALGALKVFKNRGLNFWNQRHPFHPFSNAFPCIMVITGPES